ncbi:MAG: CAP domain-containing protein [Deltaproteobacteria bacterium]|uniref:CAP domain-containing protein n=1 Tax=Candidatus Zymogenus saltonus TaxID=2844893 RepID=A0A9D8KDS2_9DELT|nr:CAP domain-containing protein [Candidatus Zymogenus saltonus]
MKRYRLLLYLLSIVIPAAIFIAAGCLPPPNYYGSPSPGGSPTTNTGVCFSGGYVGIRTDIFNLLNNERQSRGLSQLSCDATLSNIAQAHAEDMNRRNYFSHVTPEGKTHTDRIREGGSTYTYVGENLAYGQNSGREVVNKWMNSPPHMENILRREFTTMGIGASGKYYCLILAK